MLDAITSEDEHWAPVSDLMAALMLIFMFIAVIFARTIVQQKQLDDEKCDKLYSVLQSEFSDDFRNWQVDLLKDLTIRFRNPEILFLSGKTDINDKFQGILRDFFPRYVNSILPDEGKIYEIRIEGHTSSIWEGATREEAYIKNMELSQGRAYAVLQYVLQIPSSEYGGWNKEWVKPIIAASGRSSSDPRTKENGHGVFEDPELSRRVEFRLLASHCQKAGRYEKGGVQ